jgi:cbb3-type cytochrome oxidase subunit 3
MMSILFSAWTVLVAIVFLAIVIWVFRENKENFDEAARIPFEEDKNTSLDKEKDHG